jgi:UDP-GlcNAc:undecaprenyl-phosphate GlcNAc-1-phosphate transferase
MKSYLGPFIIAALICGGLTYYVKALAQRFKLADYPSPRKIHTKPIPRLGGVAIVLAFFIVVVGYELASARLNFTPFKIWFFDKHLLGAVLGALVLLVVGIWDDIRGIKPYKKLFWHFVAASFVVLFGIGIDYLRIPGGGHIDLNTLILPVTLLGRYHFTYSVWGDTLTILWIVLLINTLNFLDGLDGLASGVSVIAAVSIFFLSLSLSQPGVALLAIIFAGTVVGFLPWNFNPAKIFLGDSGSMFLGYMLGVLSVIAGGKVATALLILGIPLLDVLWVVLRRIFHGQNPFVADKLHLHHRFLAAGLSQRQAVIILYIIAAFFGIIAVLGGTQEKIQALWWLFGLMGALVIILLILEWRKRRINRV